MKFNVTDSLQFETTDCPECGLIFAVYGRFLQERREDKRSFNCPNGHGMSFTKSRAQILQDKLDQTTRAKDTAEMQNMSLRKDLSLKEIEVKKLKKKIRVKEL